MIQKFQKFAELNFITIMLHINILFIRTIKSYLALITALCHYGAGWVAWIWPQPAVVSPVLFTHPSQRWINRGGCSRVLTSCIQMRSIWIFPIRSLSPIKNVQCRASVI